LTDTDRARLARAGIAPMSVDEGLAMFDAALTSEDPLLVAARWDAAGLRARAGNGDLPGILRGLVRVPRRPAGNPQRSRAPRRDARRGGDRWGAAGQRGQGGHADPAGHPRRLRRVPRRPARNPQGSLAARLAELGREEALRLVTDTVRDHVAAVLAHGNAEK